MRGDIQDGSSPPDPLELEAIAGPCKSSLYSHLGTPLTVGRTTKSEICIKDSSVSEKHAKLEWSDQSWTLQDVGSSNGTRVNGLSIQEGVDIAIKDQDIIQFGEASILRAHVGNPMLIEMTVEQYLRAQCTRSQQRVMADATEKANRLIEDWKMAKQGLLREAGCSH